MTTADAARTTRTTSIDADPATTGGRIVRIEVRPRPEADGVLRDPHGEAVRRQVLELGLAEVPTAVRRVAVYLVAAPEDILDEAAIDRIAHELLADPVTESARVFLRPDRGPDPGREPDRETHPIAIEVHPLPGVTDPAADSVRTAIATLLGVADVAALEAVEVRTGVRWEFEGVPATAAREIALRLLANPVIQDVHDGRVHPDRFPHGTPRGDEVPDVPLRDLDDEALGVLSREGHLFLSLEEMRAVQAHYRDLGREPTAIELETLAQTWSEHCVHKTLKSTVRYREAGGPGPSLADRAAGRPGHRVEADGSVVVENLLRSTVAAATRELIDDGVDWCLSVFVDNSGVVAFDDRHAVCFKVETHNHPSAIEPYGGAATGIGGCIRDIVGTGLGAKPIAATDVFCVAPPDLAEVPAGCLPPRRVLDEVVAGVRDYGNRMGIPILDGAVWFDRRHVGNPLVFCGVVGLLPRDLVSGDARPGDRIVALGGRTGRDGIHGATFSSAELTDTHADEFSHAVQIGHAVVEKTVLDAVLAARDEPGGPIFSAITDCGAGGFSSAVGEMGERVGASVDLDRAPLKYAGLDPVEVWISEAQERMVLAVPPEHLGRLAEICAAHEVEWSDLGAFGGTDGDLVLRWRGREVGRLAMAFLHGGVPMPVREAVWSAEVSGDPPGDAADADLERLSIADGDPATILATLERLLGHPNIASKAWIVRQYDHEVQGRTVVKPISGVGEGGPTDAAVIEPIPGSGRGLAIGSGLATGWEADPYLMGLAAIDECVRNLVCSGADPSRIALLDNFCWPGCDDPRRMAALVRASEACYDGAIAYRAPFISGKDSLNNQFTTDGGETIRIPPTLLVSGFAPVPDLGRATTMDAKRAGSRLVLVGATTAATGGGHLHRVAAGPAIAALDASLPEADLDAGPLAAAAVHRAIAAGLVRSAHDPSEGGLLVAAAEMAIAGGLGAAIDLEAAAPNGPALAAAFAETPGRYLLEVAPDRIEALGEVLGDVPHAIVGEVLGESRFEVRGGGAVAARPIDDLERAWRRGALIHPETEVPA
jgi:phosphoribosylformylglycinamidine synthase II